MTQHRNTEFVGVSLTPAARDALKRMSLIVAAQRGERMSMSDVILHLETIMTSKGTRNEPAAALLHQAGWTVIAPEDEVPFICKKCGARSPIGIGYVADGQTGFPDPDPNCPNEHLRSYR